MTESAFEAKNNDEVISLLSEIRNDTLVPISPEKKQLLLREAVYGGKNQYDILEYYWENISSIKSRPGYTYKAPRSHITTIYSNSLGVLKLKLPTLKMLISSNPIKSLKYVMKWFKRKYNNTNN